MGRIDGWRADVMTIKERAPMRWRGCIAGVAMATLGAGAVSLSAQTPQPTPPPTGSLTLLDVVRATLSTQPSITLAAERLAASRGDLQAAEGQFDISVASVFTDVGTKTPNTAFEQEFQRL